MTQESYRPRIAIDARLVSSRNTGDTAYWRGLICALLQQDLGMDFLFLSNAPRPDFIPEVPNCQWIETGSKGGRYWSMVTFPTEARKLEADLIHTQYALSPLVGDKGITTVHDVSFFVGPQWFRMRDRALLQISVPKSMRQAKRVIAVSETTKAEIVAYCDIPEEKISVTYNAVPDSRQRIPKEIAREMVKQELGIEDPFVLTVGTRWPRKNMKLAVEAVGMLDDSLPHRLVVTGAEGWGDELTNDRTVGTGYVSEEVLNALFSCADAYICPSFHEGFGIPVLEAWKCGCPVICSSGGALPEVAGDAAVIVEGFEAAEWSKAIDELLHNPKEADRLVELGEARLELYSWDKTAQKTVEAYWAAIRS